MSASRGGITPLLRYSGPLEALPPDALRSLLERSVQPDAAVSATVETIIERVRRHGDEALRELAQELDGVQLARLEVPRERCVAALDALDRDLRAALERAARNIETVHRAQLLQVVTVEPEPGVIVTRRPDPLARVGVYAPGGRAAYPSSVLMGAVPARVAGVGETVLCSPPGEDGLPNDIVLAAAALAGVARVFAVGGAGAIAAMAYGTTAIPRVDRIVGPGNAYVADAKLQVASTVGIDSPAGPSELLVLADFSADPIAVAREMLAQAEHDPRAAVIAIVVGEEGASEVETALARLLPEQPRADIATAALGANGGVLQAQDYDRAIDFANAYAAEHVQLMVHEVECDAVLSRLRNTGAVFLGESSAVAFGDYIAGSNHVLPTGGRARCYSGLSMLDFVRWTSTVRVTRAAATTLAADVGMLADAEGLPAHAAAARRWLQSDASALAAEEL